MPEKSIFRGTTSTTSEDRVLTGSDVDMIVQYYQERVGELYADIEHLRSRAVYYKCEVRLLNFMSDSIVLNFLNQ